MGWKDRAEKVEKTDKGWRKRAEKTETKKEPTHMDEAKQVLAARDQGLLQGATLGFADEIGGFFKNLISGEGYEKERDQLRQELQTLEEAQPGPSLVGNIAGGAMLPAGSIRSAAAQGAAYGAGRASELEDVPLAAGVGGAVAGGVAGGLRALSGPLRIAPEKLQQFADRQRIGQSFPGITTKQAQEAVDLPIGEAGLANALRQMGARGARSSAAVQDDVVAAGDIAGKEIQDILRKVQQSGTKVNVKPTIRRLAQMARQAEATPAANAQDKANAARKAIELLQEYADDGVGMATAQRLKQAFQRDLTSGPAVDAQLSARQAVARRAAPSVRRGMLKAVREMEEELGKRYEGALQTSQIGMIARRASGRDAGRAIANRTLSPSDQAAGLAGGFATSSPLGLAAAGLNRALRGREKGLAASGAEALERALRSRPAAFGRYATKLENAAKQGRAALQASHFALYQSDPKYREQIGALEDEE